MRYHLRPSLSVLSLLLALFIPSIIVIQAVHSHPAAPPDRASSGDTRQSPSSVGGDAGTRTEAASSSLSEPEGAPATRVRQKYGLLPLSFEANRGQADARVQFLARNSAYSVYLAADEIALALRDGTKGRAEHAAPLKSRAPVLRIKLLGANRQPRAYGLDELEGKSNYLVGRDPARWRTNVPNYGRVKYEGVYPGVDVIYYGTLRQLQYDFAGAPGADAGRIRLSVEGAKGIRIDANGDLVLPTAAGEVRQHAPYAYQEIAGVRQTVSCRYVLRGAGRVGFELGAYDRGLPLVIDPVLSYSTYLGGNSYDGGTSIAADGAGQAYVTGETQSTNFPVTSGAYRTTRAGGQDVFVSKLNATGSALLYSSYLGGSGYEFAPRRALGRGGEVFVGGRAGSVRWRGWPCRPCRCRRRRARG